MDANLPDGVEFSPGWADFSHDWFSKRIPQWIEHVQPMTAGIKTRMVEVGSYEGRSCIWSLLHLLTHPESSIVCIDLWQRPELEQRFDRNIAASGVSHKVIKRKGDGVEMLRHVPACDVAYIDADHTAKAVIVQAGLIWPRLRVGGIVIFDDYPWKKEGVKHPPGPGIDAFLTFWEGRYELLHKGWQVLVRKVA